MILFSGDSFTWGQGLEWDVLLKSDNWDVDNDGNKELLLESGRPYNSQECSTINGYKLTEGKLQKTRI